MGARVAEKGFRGTASDEEERRADGVLLPVPSVMKTAIGTFLPGALVMKTTTSVPNAAASATRTTTGASIAVGPGLIAAITGSL